MIHLYYGDGKGKTTAALGLALRAAGYGQRICIVQFLKNSPTGELASLEKLAGVTVLRGKAGAPLTFAMSAGERAQTLAIHNENLCQAIRMVEQGACELLILDEAVDALQMKLVDAEPLLAFLDAHREDAEIVLTGHAPEADLLARADYITEMRKKKHPFDAGVPARKGVEY